MRPPRLAPPLLVLLLAASGAPPAEACATAPPEGRAVAIADEEAIIAWDEERKVEHFVRRAVFDTDAKDFGFLVPTPSVPELAEADDAVFERLERAIRPKIVYEKVREYSVGCWSIYPFLMGRGVESAMAPGEAEPVRVLASQRVAGLDAVVLEAESAGALGAWLEKNGYPFRPSLEKWIAPYVAEKWKITAFKFAGDRGDAGATVGSKAVRMSFAAERPFYPYREPEDASAPAGRLLRVFLVGGARMDASLGGAARDAKVEYAERPSDLGAMLQGALPEGALPDRPWLTAMLDRSQKRVPGDVSFALAPSAPAIVPEPVVVREPSEVVLPLEPLFLGAGVFFWARRRRRKDGTAGEP